MNTPVQNVSLAHIRFLSDASKKLKAAGGETDETVFSFEVMLSMMMDVGSKNKEMSEFQNILINDLPFLLAQSSITPYLLIAATTEAHGLVPYIKEPNSETTKAAIDEAVNTCFTMDAVELARLVLDFFGKFAPWRENIPGYLAQSRIDPDAPINVS